MAAAEAADCAVAAADATDAIDAVFAVTAVLARLAGAKLLLTISPTDVFAMSLAFDASKAFFAAARLLINDFFSISSSRRVVAAFLYGTLVTKPSLLTSKSSCLVFSNLRIKADATV